MTDLAREIAMVADGFRIDPALLMALVRTESSCRPHAYRFEPEFWRRYMADKPAWAGALPERVSASYGLMQIMYPVACEHGFRDDPELLFVPRVNLFWGCTHLSSLLRWAGGNVDQALAAYNGGKGGNGAPPYRNAAYVVKVRGFMTAAA